MSSKIMVVLGTRPEAIKLAPLIVELRKRLSVTICSTGQHKEMLASALAAFGIRPDVDLQLMTPNQSLARISAQTLEQLDRVFESDSPDALVVQGDTTTCAFAGLAAFYRKIPVFHVEAGLRSFSMSSPFPEELNRRLVGLVAQGHFCPTPAARRNLIQEGTNPLDILTTGNTGIDALFLMRERLASGEHRLALPAADSPFVLATLHRRESFGEPLLQLFRSLLELAQKHGLNVILPLHMNPKVRETAVRVFSAESGRKEFAGGGSLTLLDPIDYASFTSLLLRCSLIITDSGGIQEEAATLGKPMVVCRERTERNEALALPGVRLLNPASSNLVSTVLDLLRNQDVLVPSTVFGDGQASRRIADGIDRYFKTGHISAEATPEDAADMRPLSL